MTTGPPIIQTEAVTASLRKACIDLLDLLVAKQHPKPFFICFDEAHTLTAQPRAETRTNTSLNNLEWVLSHLRHLDLSEDTVSPSNSESKSLHQSQPSQPKPSQPTADVHKPGNLFTLFISTDSDIGKVAMPIDRHPSHRVRSERTLFTPITELPFDVFVQEIGKTPTLESVSQLKYAAMFGRPLYVPPHQIK